MTERRPNDSQEGNINFTELSLLYQFSNTLLSTIRLNKLTHLILTALTSGKTPFFERAMLFLFNERSGALQGMLGVTKNSLESLQLIGEQTSPLSGRWDISDEVIASQLKTDFCKRVKTTRIDMDDDCIFIKQAVSEKKIYFTGQPHNCQQSVCEPINRLGASIFAAVPLISNEKLIGIIIVDNHCSSKPFSDDNTAFLQLFANQAGMAMENSMLYNQVQEAHSSLRTAREQLIHGERMAAIGEMATNLVHELKNPLITIGGFAGRLVKALPENSRELRYAETIERETGHLEKMLTDILAFSRKPTICYNRCDLIQIIKDGLEGCTPTMEDHNISVKSFLGEGPWTVIGDAQQLRQVFLNLLLNAADAMPEGGSIKIKVQKNHPAADYITISLADTGGGVPAEILHMIFNPFFTTKRHGTGLGLSIIKRILQNHNGSISVSNSDHGAIFTVNLPLSQ